MDASSQFWELIGQSQSMIGLDANTNQPHSKTGLIAIVNEEVFKLPWIG